MCMTASRAWYPATALHVPSHLAKSKPSPLCCRKPVWATAALLTHLSQQDSSSAKTTARLPMLNERNSRMKLPGIAQCWPAAFIWARGRVQTSLSHYRSCANSCRHQDPNTSKRSNVCYATFRVLNLTVLLTLSLQSLRTMECMVSTTPPMLTMLTLDALLWPTSSTTMAA